MFCNLHYSQAITVCHILQRYLTTPLLKVTRTGGQKKAISPLLPYSPLDQVSIIETNKNCHIYPASKQQGGKVEWVIFCKHL